MKVYIPFKSVNPKSRLGKVLTEKEREKFAFCMLYDVVESVEKAGFEPNILATQKLGLNNEIVDPRDLNSAINDRIKEDSPLMVVMSDLALIRPENLKEMSLIDADVVIAPGKRGGTNVLLVRNPDFRVSYYGLSFLKHIGIAEELEISYSIYSSLYTFVDVDDEMDLIEVMIHGRSRSRDFLKKCGFRIEIRGKDPVLVRN